MSKAHTLLCMYIYFFKKNMKLPSSTKILKYYNVYVIVFYLLPVGTFN